MSALIASVFVASLLGSMHCAGMCGAFVAFAVGFDDDRPGPARWRLHAAYNGGRLLTYAGLGAIAGLIGGALDMAGSMVGVSRVAAAAAGATLILFGGAHLLRALGVRLGTVRPPRLMQNALRSANRAAMALPPIRRALVIGLMTTLLPCGWLYAFVAAAAGTGDAALGALTMAVFWAGTLPILVAVGAGVRAAAGPLGSRLPVLMPLLVMAAGLYTIVSRLGVSAEDLRGVGARVEAASLEQAGARLGELDPHALPCCGGEAPGAPGAPGEDGAAAGPEACDGECCVDAAARGEVCGCCSGGDGG